jgi:hypothetical protein
MPPAIFTTTNNFYAKLLNIFPNVFRRRINARSRAGVGGVCVELVWDELGVLDWLLGA